VIIFLCHIRSNTVGLREIDVFSATFDSLLLTMHKTLPTDWLTYVQNILQPSFVAPSKLNDSYLPPYSILFTNNAALATVVNPYGHVVIWWIITELANTFPHSIGRSSLSISNKHCVSKQQFEVYCVSARLTARFKSKNYGKVVFSRISLLLVPEPNVSILRITLYVRY